MIRLQPEDGAEIRDNYFLVRCGFQRQRQRQPRNEVIEHVEVAEPVLRLSVSSIKRPEHVPVETVRSDKFLFDRAIEALHADERRVSLPISHGTSYGRGNYQSTVFSTRVKTDFAADERRPVPFQTRAEKLHGKCVELCPTTNPPIWTKPTHDFCYGDQSKLEPTPKQIEQWMKKYTKNGEFKKVSYQREFARSPQHSNSYTGIIFGEPYQGQLQVPLYRDQVHPPKSHPSTLDSIFPTRIDTPDYIVWTSSVRPLGFYGGVTPCTPPGIQVPEINWTCLFNCEPTRQQLTDAEEALRINADYDPKLHAELGHLYKYWSSKSEYVGSVF